MRLKVVRKQENSRMCFVCGVKNPFGIKAYFYELENGEVMAIFHPRDEHQGYPGRLHGGIAAAILDETIGRVGMIRYGEKIWGVTLDFRIRFRRPLPLDAELRVLGRITDENKRSFTGTGEILLPDGKVGAEGEGRYLKLSIDEIAEFDVEEEEWRVISDPAEPTDFEIS